MLWYRKHLSREGMVLALADQDLMDKNFEEGDFLLSITSFYKGELIAREEVASLLGEAKIINAVGEGAVAVLLESGLTTKETIRKTAGIPHVQTVKITI
ncbi:MAG: DUF424 family protein [Candidatus Altiarchaeota archaeon]|nr:DUF424 family protein [Candidatus Altiarchaeota archaeon]